MRNWIYYNFLGWILGVITGPFFINYVIVGSRDISKMSEDLIYDPLAKLFYSFPVGICLNNSLSKSG